MAQQILIIGLGQFGMSLARTLSEKGAEVLAVDSRKDLVEEASAFVAEALVVNAADENELARLGPEKRDAVVCAIGDDSKESSIICTALLRQMGAPFVVSRANDKLHQRILHLVGAHQIINPEQEFGQRFANRLLYRHVIAQTSYRRRSASHRNPRPDRPWWGKVSLNLPFQSVSASWWRRSAEVNRAA